MDRGSRRRAEDFTVTMSLLASNISQLERHQELLVANALAQTQALMLGRDASEVEAEMKTAGASPETIAIITIRKRSFVTTAAGRINS